MIIGTPKEIKNNEYRVGMVPAGVYMLKSMGHRILIEKGAGEGSGIPDKEFLKQGAEIVETPQEVWQRSDLVVKVKEPLPSEYPLLRAGLALFTYVHLADPRAKELTLELMKRKVASIAYETVEGANGGLPLLKPMSEVAGRLSVQVGATFLERPRGGRGVMLGGVPGVLPALVLVLGGGTVGINATKIALGFGARVIVLDVDQERLEYLDTVFGDRLETLMSSQYQIAQLAPEADLIVGGVLRAGRRAPVVMTREMVRSMRPSSMIVDVAVDQGGCIETTHATSHASPTYVEEGVIHYAVDNMPGCVPRTSTFALTNMTLPYVYRMAGMGILEALRGDKGFLLGLNTYQGECTCVGVAEAHALKYHDPLAMMK